jgi:hypothetical protein
MADLTPADFDYSRSCRWCDGPMPKNLPEDRKACSTQCAKDLASHKGRARADSVAVNNAKVITPAMRQFKELIEDDKDFVREILTETIRDEVTAAVRDNLVGAAETLTMMLPKAMADLHKDLGSKDWTIRKAARDAVLKYAMMFKDKESDKDDLGTIHVFHKVDVPDTEFGRAVGDNLEQFEQEAQDDSIEAFEKDWPICDGCKERKHPETVTYNDEEGDRIRVLCSSCLISAKLQLGSGASA